MWYQSSNGSNSLGSVLIAVLMLAFVCVIPAGVMFAQDSGTSAETEVVAEETAPQEQPEEAPAQAAQEQEPETPTETESQEEGTNENNTEGADGAAGTDGGSGDVSVTTGDAVSGVDLE